jgi:hypothetical protein
MEEVRTMKTETITDRPADQHEREVVVKDVTDPKLTPKTPQPEKDVRGGRIWGVLRIAMRAPR